MSVHKEMLRLCGPLIAGNILQQFYNTIDAWIVGRYAGQLEFAAIGIAGTAMNLFLFFVIGLCTGISVMFAQLFGAGDKEGFRKEHFQILVCGGLLSILLAAAGILIEKPLLILLGTPSRIMSYTSEYLMIVLAGLPFAFLYNFYNCMLRAVGNVKVPLIILAAAVFTNLIADLYFVRNLGMGIQGAAAATVLSEAFSAAAGITYVCLWNRKFCFGKKDIGFSARLLAKTASVSLVTGIHQAGLYIGKMAVQGAVNSAGTDLITAYTAATRIEGFINSFGDSGASATSVIVAQSYGAGNQSREKSALRASAVILFLFGAVCSVLLFLTAPAAASFMLGSGTKAALSQATRYLRLIAVFYLFCFLGNTFAGFFDGIGKTWIPFVGAAFHITLRAILSWLWVTSYGLAAVAAACGIGWILADLFWLIILLFLLKRN